MKHTFRFIEDISTGKVKLELCEVIIETLDYKKFPTFPAKKRVYWNNIPYFIKIYYQNIILWIN